MSIIPINLFAPPNIFNNLFWGIVLAVALGATIRQSVKYLFLQTLDRKQEIAFWLTLPGAILIALLALRFGTAPTTDSQLSVTLHDMQNEITGIKQNEAERARHVWPTLTGAQQTSLHSRLSEITPKESYFVTCNDANCDALANQLSLVMQSAQFVPTQPMRSTVSGISDGVTILADDHDATAHKVHDAIQDVLSKTAKVQFFADPSMTQGDNHHMMMMIIVGVRR